MRNIHLVLGIAALLLLAGCLGQQPGTDTGQQGSFSLLVSDQPTQIGTFDSLTVTFDEARIFESNTSTGFESLDISGVSVDLTTVTGIHATEILNTSLTAGTYEKIELHVASVEGVVDGESVGVMVPANKLMIVKPFTVSANETTEFVFDIKVVQRGRTGEYNLLPVISESGVVGEDVQVERVPRTPVEREGRSPSITVRDQEITDGMVTIPSAFFDEPGYIVIHKQVNGSVGPVIGNSDLLQAGTVSNMDVSINTTAATDTIYGMLHYDDGDGVYEFPDGDAPVTVNGSIVVKPFSTTLQGSETLPASFTLETEDGSGCPNEAFYYKGEQRSEITIPENKNVTITFAPRADCTYSGGAQFYSVPDSVFGESDSVQGGETTKVTFSASQDFTIEQWWPNKGQKKGEITVHVQ